MNAMLKMKENIALAFLFMATFIVFPPLQGTTTAPSSEHTKTRNSFSPTPSNACENQTCKPLNISEEAGTASCTNGENWGSVCTITCNRRYVFNGLIGENVITCSAGNDDDGTITSWSLKRTLYCRPLFCPDLQKIANGDFRCTRRFKGGSICKHMCDEGFLLDPLDHEGHLCYKNGSWLGRPTPRCIAFECGTIPSTYLRDGVQYSSNFSASGELSTVSPAGRITQQETTNITQYPWTVVIFKESKPSFYPCGGSIISSKWVLTSVSCFGVDDVTTWTAYFGISDLSQRRNGTGESRRIVSFITHPNYTRKIRDDYNIALVELEENLSYTKFIQPICIPPQSFVFPYGMECYNSGWNIIFNNGEFLFSTVIQHDQVVTISNETCNRLDWYNGNITERMLCAGKIDGRSSNQAYYLFGYPLSCYIANNNVWMIAGIESWCADCGFPKRPVVYIKLSLFTDWIWNIIVQSEIVPPTAPAIPGVKRAFECGTIPSTYLRDGVQYSGNFSASGELSSVHPAGRITQQETTNITQYPWTVALFRGNFTYPCGGSIISSRWVLTSAQCTAFDDVTKWTAYFGISDLSQRRNGTGESRKIVSFILHPNYTNHPSIVPDYDVTLAELEENLSYTKFIQPICIPPQSYVFPDGMKCYYSGWGGVTFNDGGFLFSTVIQHDQVVIISNETCNRPDWNNGTVTERMLCAGKIDGRGSYQGANIGSPLSCYIANNNVWMIAGIESWCAYCGLPKRPRVFTKLSFFTDWIWNKIGQSEGLLLQDPTIHNVEEGQTEGLCPSTETETPDVVEGQSACLLPTGSAPPDVEEDFTGNPDGVEGEASSALDSISPELN